VLVLTDRDRRSGQERKLAVVLVVPRCVAAVAPAEPRGRLAVTVGLLVAIVPVGVYAE
jgi:hypothetical protein